MNELQIFTNTEFGEVRTILREGEPWFVAADVCRALEIDRTATRRLDDDEKDVHSTHTLGGDQEITIINEPGLYTLVLGSRKPEAKAFKRWITHEVVPTIRKHGMYAADELLNNPDLLIKAATRIKEQNEQIAQLTDENAEKDERIAALEHENDICKRTALKHYAKSMWADAALEKGENLSIRDTAKEIGVKETEFTKMLVELKYLYRRPTKQNRLFPYSTPKCQGVFVVKEIEFGSGLVYQSQTLVTPIGRVKLTAECVRAGLIPAMPEEHDVLEVW